MLDSINFTDLSRRQVVEVLSWRNHPAIRNHMRNKETISLTEHLQFIEQLSTVTSKRYFYVHEKCEGVGTFSLTGIKDGSAEIGIYVNPFLHSKGYGNQIIDFMINYAFDLQNLSTLFLEVYKDNAIAVQFYEKNDFIKYDESNDMYMMKLQSQQIPHKR